MFDGVLSGFHIHLIGLFACFQPWDVLGRGNGLGGDAVLATAGETLVFHESLAEETWCRRRRHSDNVGERAGDVLFAVSVSVTATLAMVFLAAFVACCSEGRESLRVVYGRYGWCWFPGMMSTWWA